MSKLKPIWLIAFGFIGGLVVASVIALFLDLHMPSGSLWVGTLGEWFSGAGTFATAIFAVLAATQANKNSAAQTKRIRISELSAVSTDLVALSGLIENVLSKPDGLKDGHWLGLAVEQICTFQFLHVHRSREFAGFLTPRELLELDSLIGEWAHLKQLTSVLRNAQNLTKSELESVSSSLTPKLSSLLSSIYKINTDLAFQIAAAAN